MASVMATDFMTHQMQEKATLTANSQVFFPLSIPQSFKLMQMLNLIQWRQKFENLLTITRSNTCTTLIGLSSCTAFNILIT